MKVNDGDIYNDDYSYHGYYIIKFSSSPYTLQEDLIFYGQAIYSGGMVCEGTISNQYELSLLCFTKN